MTPDFNPYLPIFQRSAAYTNALEEKPLTAKALTSLVGWALGDILAQVSVGHEEYVYRPSSDVVLFSSDGETQHTVTRMKSETRDIIRDIFIRRAQWSNTRL